MNISFVTDTFTPQLNGVALTARRFVRGLRSRGHRIELIRPAGLAPDETGLEVPYTPIPLFPGIRMGIPRWGNLRDRWTRARPDLVYVATESPLGASAITTARALKIPVASGFHTNFPQYAAPYRLPFLERLAIAHLRRFHNRSDRTFVPTGELADQLKREGFHRLELLPRGVDSRLFAPEKRDPGLRSEWGLDSGSGLAGLYVGRMASEKNLPAAIRAFSEIRRSVPDFCGIFVGDGPKRAELMRKHPEFRFPGARSGEELARIFASADLFLFPSLTETFGNVVLEAMASGLGVVAYDYAAARQHIRNGINGYTVPFGDESDFVKTALSAARDSRLLEIRAAARERAAAAGWDPVIGRFEESLIELAACSNPANPGPAKAASGRSDALLSPV